MNHIINIIFLIAFFLLSIAFFLFVYNHAGLHFTVSCLLSWGWSIVCYGFMIWLFKKLKEDIV
jgi:hypothetical protein